MKQDLGAEEIEKLARWHNTLNHWKWPEDLPGKPEGFDELPAFYFGGDIKNISSPTKHIFIRGLMDNIRMIIGHKECLRYHHIHNLGKTQEEFEEWWVRNHEIVEGIT